MYERPKIKTLYNIMILCSKIRHYFRALTILRSQYLIILTSNNAEVDRSKSNLDM